MPRAVEKSGKTIDDAVQEALAELNASIDDVVIDVLDEGDSGILGIGRKPVRVLVTVDNLTLNGEPADPHALPDSEQASTIDEESVRESLDNAFGSALPNTDEVAVEADAVYFGDDADSADRETEDLALKGMDFLETIFDHMDIRADFSYTQDKDHIKIDIEGEDVGAVIGQRGDTLNALQYLTSLVVNRESKEHIYLSVDIAGYRKRRERSLTDMAKRTARKVVEVGKEYVMEPMSASERRIIHTALQDYPGIKTESEGTPPKRSVVIIPLDKK